MSFRKRNVGIIDTRESQNALNISAKPQNVSLPGTRPSGIDGRPVTSTGVASLDGLMAGHGGIPLGTTLLLEETGTTDYAGALLRFYASQGLLHDHVIHLLGVPDQWARDLPGLASESSKKQPEPTGVASDRMKIAWRYEGLGQHDASPAARERATQVLQSSSRANVDTTRQPFCHSFDLSKRLERSRLSQLITYQPGSDPRTSPFENFLSRISSALVSSTPRSVHRLIIPSLFSPMLYSPQAQKPATILPFFHKLRQLLAMYPDRLTVMITLPLLLSPRTSGLTRWLEILNDGVFELTPFPHSADAEFSSSRDPSSKEEPPQGLLHIHKMPLYHELGGGIPPSDMMWTFILSRRKFTIKPFDLPPIEGDSAAQHAADKPVASKAEIEF